VKVCEESTKAGSNVTPQLRYFLEELFSRLDEEAVLYCVLRNYESLPEHVGNDIDVLVHQDHIGIFRDCLLSAAKTSGWLLVKNPSRFAFESFWFRNPRVGKFVQIDVWAVLHWKGIAWGETGWILRNRKRLRKFFIPSPAVEAGVLLIKDVIEGGIIKTKYHEIIQRTAQQELEAVREFLAWSLGEDIAAWLSEKSQEQQWENIEQARTKIRLAVIKRAFYRNPLSVILNFARFLWGHLRARFAKPAGMFVVFVGPDGSGKSTVADRLDKSLAKLFSKREYYHGHFGILPELKVFRNFFLRLLGKKLPEPPVSEYVQVENPRANGFFRALMYVCYYSLDYFVGYLVVNKACAYGDLIIFDRYFYDFFIQPQFRLVPERILLTISKLLPHPDILLYLKCEPKEIHKRKPELALEEIDRQQKVIEAVLLPQKNCYMIETSENPDETVSRICGLISEHMQRRFSI